MNILVTGGASGLGNAITRTLAVPTGTRIYFTYNRSLEAAQLLEKECTNCTGIKCDFENQDDVNELAARIESLDIDVLINNAYSGKPVKTHFHKISAADFQSEFRINIMPVILLTQACIKYFRKKKSGRIITILTAYLHDSPPVGTAAYVGGKAFLASLVKSWAAENGKYNISSNAVSPSFMRTGLAADVDERIIEQMIAGHPLKKLLTVEETAAAVASLVNAPAEVNGTEVVIHAGTNIK
ncbi:MAG: SDR family oxidoreductase [Ferruginibacter sp.]